MNCDCIKTVNARLEERNLRLDDNLFALHAQTFATLIQLPTRWVDKTKAPKGEARRPSSIRANFCPFCGKDARTAQQPDPDPNEKSVMVRRYAKDGGEPRSNSSTRSTPRSRPRPTGTHSTSRRRA